MIRRNAWACCILLALYAPTALAQPDSNRGNSNVVNSPHNLSVSGPGAYRSMTVAQVCVFCHAPHSSVPNAPIWNRRDNGQNYIQYSSSTLVAISGQPAGSSRLCLACHDGTVALERLASLSPEAVEHRSNKRLAGRSSLGTDLADDHPISFIYDAALQAASGHLAHPASVPLPLEDGMVQCGTCHEPHDNTLEPFLRMTSDDGQLCTACHVQAGMTWDWASSAHATSTQRPRGAKPWKERKPQWQGKTVAQNACFNCHTPHNAATPARLITDREEATCYRCHDGSVAESDIQSDFLKPSRHPVDVTPNPDHDAAVAEDPLRTRLHAECSDCHNPHATRADRPMVTVDTSRAGGIDGFSLAPLANAQIAGVPGLTGSGAVTQSIENQYELCFKCHGQPGRSACGNSRCSTARDMAQTRVDGIYNIRDKVDPTSNPGLVSYHPIVQNNPFNNNDVGSLRTDLGLNTTDTLIYCTDCHNSDESSAGTGSGAEGPHGSIYPPLLAQRYTLNTRFIGLGTASTEAALCFKCHDESRLRNNFGGDGFNHASHEESASCITCHDPHGSVKFKHLLNFETNNNLVSPGHDPATTGAGAYSEPTWVETQNGGECWLNCHNTSDHLGSSYPEGFE